MDFVPFSDRDGWMLYKLYTTSLFRCSTALFIAIRDASEQIWLMNGFLAPAFPTSIRRPIAAGPGWFRMQPYCLVQHISCLFIGLPEGYEAADCLRNGILLVAVTQTASKARYGLVSTQDRTPLVHHLPSCDKDSCLLPWSTFKAFSMYVLSY